MDFKKLKDELDKRDLSEIPTATLATLLIKLMELESQSIGTISARNSVPTATNDLTDYQKIKTAEFTVPVIYADVLYYRPGELGNGSDIGREGAHVYYSPESISDPEYLETVKRSAISVGTHEKNTGEYNRDVDGWPVKVWYDEDKKCVMVTGVVHGEENVEYVEKHKNDKDFGSSAYIDFLGVKKESGVSTTGNKYTAKTTKLVNNHIALLPNIRDKKNVIIAMNAMEEDNDMAMNAVIRTNDIKSTEYRDIVNEINRNSQWVELLRKYANKNGVSLNDAIAEASEHIWRKDENFVFNSKNSTGAKNVKEEIKSALNELDEEKSKAKEFEDMKNALNAANQEIADLKAKNKAYEGKETPEEEKEEKKLESENALNANPVPSQELIKNISGHYGMEYPKTPSFQKLASDIGINTKDVPLAEIVSALNAKQKEILAETPSAQNSGGSFQSMLEVM